MTIDQLTANRVLRGPLFPEPVEVLVTVPMGDAVKLVGRGVQSGQVVDIILTPDKLALLQTSPEVEPFDGDPHRFRLGIEAMRLQLAFEYDPYFSLSIARVDPLPHQLEAVYDYFLRLPRIRFLLADDPGAGKTIMAANDDPGDLIPPPPQEQTFDVYLLDAAGVPICDEQGNRLSLRGQGPFINVEALHPLETFTQSADLTLLLQAHVGETLTLVFEFYALNGTIEAHVDEVDLSISSKARTP